MALGIHSFAPIAVLSTETLFSAMSRRVWPPLPAVPDAWGRLVDAGVRVEALGKVFAIDWLFAPMRLNSVPAKAFGAMAVYNTLSCRQRYLPAPSAYPTSTTPAFVRQPQACPPPTTAASRRAVSPRLRRPRGARKSSSTNRLPTRRLCVKLTAGLFPFCLRFTWVRNPLWGCGVRGTDLLLSKLSVSLEHRQCEDLWPPHRPSRL